MRFLMEQVIGDYASYTKAAMNQSNVTFVHMSSLLDVNTIKHFLESLEEKGVVFCASQSMVDCEFWIACPKGIHTALIGALREWSHSGRGGDLSMPKPKRGIFHSIMDLPFSL
jgi:hypothetical protein